MYWNIRHSFWHIFWHFSGISSDIHSNISSDILSDSVSGISFVWHLFWHSILWISATLFWHTFWHSCWHIFWHSFRRSFWQIFWHSFWRAFWIATPLTLTMKTVGGTQNVSYIFGHLPTAKECNLHFDTCCNVFWNHTCGWVGGPGKCNLIRGRSKLHFWKTLPVKEGVNKCNLETLPNLDASFSFCFSYRCFALLSLSNRTLLHWVPAWEGTRDQFERVLSCSLRVAFISFHLPLILHFFPVDLFKRWYAQTGHAGILPGNCKESFQHVTINAECSFPLYGHFFSLRIHFLSFRIQVLSCLHSSVHVSPCCAPFSWISFKRCMVCSNWSCGYPPRRWPFGISCHFAKSWRTDVHKHSDIGFLLTQFPSGRKVKKVVCARRKVQRFEDVLAKSCFAHLQWLSGSSRTVETCLWGR